jgi:hypothetical protein
MLNFNADLINALFEASAGLFVLNHCRVLYEEKRAHGVSKVSVAYFIIWGIWNGIYYPSLNQPMSFFGGIFIVVANVIYLCMLYWYRDAMSADEHAIYLGAENCVVKAVPVEKA